MEHGKLERLEATVVQQQKQIEALATSLESRHRKSRRSATGVK
jgi:hypothetical protein